MSVALTLYGWYDFVLRLSFYLATWEKAFIINYDYYFNCYIVVKVESILNYSFII